MSEGVYRELDENYGDGDYALRCTVVGDNVEIVVVSGMYSDAADASVLSAPITCTVREAAEVCTKVAELTDYGYEPDTGEVADLAKAADEDQPTDGRVEEIIKALIAAAI